MDGWTDGCDGVEFTHMAVGVELDDRPSLSVALMRTVGGAAKLKVRNWSRTKATAGQSPPRCCIARELAVTCSESNCPRQSRRRTGKQRWL